MRLRGTWFYVWNLWNRNSKQILPWGDPDTLLNTLGPWLDDIDGFCVKVADGSLAFNQVGGNDKHIKNWIDTIRAAGKEVEGWQYVYSDNPGPCGDRAEERREKLGLNMLLVDAEKEWNLPYGANKKAKLYMDKLHNGAFDVGLNTYRFPDFFPSFPFDAFADHDKNDFVCPQVYWLGRHNPVEQLMESYEQYRVITNKPFVPAACAFGEQLKSGYWEPSIEDIVNMRDASLSKFGGIIWWSRDWLWNMKKWEWMTAICGSPAAPPPPPPPPPSEFPKMVKVKASASPYLNVRDAPDGADIGDLTPGTIVTVIEQQGDWLHVRDGWIHKGYVDNV